MVYKIENMDLLGLTIVGIRTYYGLINESLKNTL